MRVGESVVGVHAPVLVLTYDDGPTPGVTDRLLTTLSEHGATATFFVLLSRVRRAPALLAETLAAGHEVGLHGIDHRRLTTVPRRELRGLMRDGRRALEDAAGRQVRWFRAPYGAQSRASWRAATGAGLTPVMWAASCHDWLTLPPEEYLQHVRDRSLAGEVLLLHDGFADERDGAYDGPPPALDRVGLTRGVLAEAAEQGLSVSSLGAATAAAGPRLEVRLSAEAGRRVRLRRAMRAAVPRRR